MHNVRGTNDSFIGILIHAYLNRLEAADNAQNILGVSMEISGKPQLLNWTLVKFNILEWVCSNKKLNYSYI